MKRIVSFLILLAMLIAVFHYPAAEAPAAAPHPFPLWSVLCYLAAVVFLALVSIRMIRGEKAKAEPKLA